ncbi:MAG: hypothetical protein D6698_04630 [Gammaproteobacteria bacterium]|nr:MAG: hypothetical protein D6698_04630 [Gammaproteobacteria bacterium]
MSRHHDMPVLVSRDVEIESVLYNLWRRARLHLALPIRFAIPVTGKMILIVEAESWIVVDGNRNDLPILAWVDFQDKGRDSLHTPVQCTLNYYHYLASRIRVLALQTLQEGLEKSLHLH